MNQQQIFTYMSSLVALFGIGYLLVQYRLLFMEFFRQDLFRLRDSVFDYARSGKIGFNHPAYIMLRHTTNGWIRFAHQRTMWQGLVLLVLRSRTDKEDKEFIQAIGFEYRWSQATADLDDEVRNQLEEYRKQLDFLSLRYFIISAPECSIGLFMILLIVIPIKMIYQNRKVLPGIMKTWFTKTDEAALFYGEQTVAI